MKKSIGVALVLLLLSCGVVAAEEYLTIEGTVKKITGTFLLIGNSGEAMHTLKHFPISPFVQVFDKSGRVSSLAAIANVGYVSKARISVLKGKVERIIIVDQFQ